MPSIDRRTFLTSSAAATVGLSLAARTAVAGETRHRKFTMDLTPGMVGISGPLPEIVALAHRHGFESVAPDAGYIAGLSDGGLEELLADLEAKELVWGTAGLPVDFRRDEETFTDGLERLPEFARHLERAGVTRVATWITPQSDTLTYLENFHRHARRLREVAQVLGARGLRLGLEYVGPKTSWTAGRFPFIHTMKEMQELIAEIGEPNVGLLLDSWHWYHADETAEDILALSNEDVVDCHVNDAPADIPKDEQVDLVRALPAATGVIDLAAFLGALVQIGYDGPVRAEPFDKELNALDNEAAAAKTAAAMRKAFSLVE